MFRTPDALADEYPGWNSYHYAANNPKLVSDPTGMNWYLNLHQGIVVWIDGSDNRFDSGYIDLGELNGPNDTSIGDITNRLDAMNYEYSYTSEAGLSVDTRRQYRGWIIMQTFSPENVGVALGLGSFGSNLYTGRGGFTPAFSVSGKNSASLLNKPNVIHPKLQNIVNDLYKGAKGPNPIGSGSTADAVRNELATGVATHGNFHSQKAREYINALSNWQRNNPNASVSDRHIAEMLKRDLQNALNGK